MSKNSFAPLSTLPNQLKPYQALLKPCPLCGQKDPVVNILPQDVGYLVRCSDCNLNLKVTSRFAIQAVASWNFRDGKIDLSLPEDI